MLAARFCDPPPDAAYIAAPQLTDTLAPAYTWGPKSNANPTTNENWNIQTNGSIYRPVVSRPVEGPVTYVLEFEAGGIGAQSEIRISIDISETVGPGFIAYSPWTFCTSGNFYRLEVSATSTLIAQLEFFIHARNDIGGLEITNSTQLVTALCSLP